MVPTPAESRAAGRVSQGRGHQDLRRPRGCGCAQAGARARRRADEEHAPQDDETTEIAVEPKSVAPADLTTNRRVFITHGKDKKIVEQLKELLAFGEFEPVVSIERESVSKPVPDKVFDDMRSCAAAVIHVGTEQRLLDEKGEEHRVTRTF